jgi:catechol 2,3-dioxygenase-like lactoylglutathione lyase family enzyme
MSTSPDGKLSMVIFFGKDLPALARFYRDALGLAVIGDPEDEHWIELDAGGCRLALHRGKATGSGAKIVFGTRDLKSARKRLVAGGATVGETIASAGVQRCDFKDPAGNRCQLSTRGLS